MERDHGEDAPEEAVRGLPLEEEVLGDVVDLHGPIPEQVHVEDLGGVCAKHEFEEARLVVSQKASPDCVAKHHP